MFEPIEMGNFLKRRRQELRLSQQQVAQAVGISVQAYSKYETGKNLPSAARVTDLARVLKTSEAAVLGVNIADERKDTVEELRCKLHKSIDSADEETIRALAGLLRIYAPMYYLDYLDKSESLLLEEDK